MTDLPNGASEEPTSDELGDPVVDGDETIPTTYIPDEDDEGDERDRRAATPAPACRAALKEATQRWPNCRTASDGIMCDGNHDPSSDHCAGNAFDLTHDPANGCDAHALVEGLRQRRDPRVKYIISNRRIWNLGIVDAWRPYNGVNSHTVHAHVSIHAAHRNDTSPFWSAAPGPVHSGGGDDWRTHPQLKRGVGDPSMVRHMQDLLIRAAHDLSQEVGADGKFGPGTERELKAYQAHRGLRADGICGPKTWERLHQ